ncbi:MAG: hypothetical protein ACLFRF_09270, partial [Desulfobacterales bacterium]
MDGEISVSIIPVLGKSAGKRCILQAGFVVYKLLVKPHKILAHGIQIAMAKDIRCACGDLIPQFWLPHFKHVSDQPVFIQGIEN